MLSSFLQGDTRQRCLSLCLGGHHLLVPDAGCLVLLAGMGASTVPPPCLHGALPETGARVPKPSRQQTKQSCTVFRVSSACIISIIFCFVLVFACDTSARAPLPWFVATTCPCSEGTGCDSPEHKCHWVPLGKVQDHRAGQGWDES